MFSDRRFGPRRAAQLWAALLLCFATAGCRRDVPPAATVEITEVPPAAAGGPAQMDYIEGRVHGAVPGEQIVLYVHTNAWWVQPTTSHPFTNIQRDFMWKGTTHLGDSYAALLVQPGYHPESKVAALPVIGKEIAAITVLPALKGLPIAPRQLSFSGYEWSVQAAPSGRGGEINAYGASNAWVDQKGHLHLRMQYQNGRWTCAEVLLNRSLGYGTYSFIVEDSARLEPWAVVGLYVLDDDRADITRRELDVELSYWGKRGGWNAQYVVQPYYVPQNIYHARLPDGRLIHSFRWEPGSAVFDTRRPEGSPVAQHVFTSGIPEDSGEVVHMDLYDFYHSRHPADSPTDVVIDRFEYLP